MPHSSPQKQLLAACLPRLLNAAAVACICCFPLVARGEDSDRVRQTAPVTPAAPLLSEAAVVLADEPGSSSGLVESNLDQLSEPATDDPDSICGAESLEFPQFEEAFAEQPATSGNRSNTGSNQPRRNSSLTVRPRLGRRRQANNNGRTNNQGQAGKHGRGGNRPRLIRKVAYAAIGLPSVAMKFLPEMHAKGGCWHDDKWMAWGFYNNSHGLGGATGNAPLRFNGLAEELALHQAWYHVRREPNYYADGFGWGMGLDVMFGADGPDVQVGNSPLQLSIDNEWDNTWDTSNRYGFAIPQMYLEGAWKCWSAKVGRFFSPLGYERVQAHQNFFYSHSYAFNYNQPLAHWGVMLRKNWGLDLTTFSGRTTGWDTSLSNHDNEGKQTFFGFDYEPSPWFKLHGALTWGDPGDLSDADTDFYLHETYARLGITESLDYVLAHSFQTRTRPFGTTPVNAFKMYGLANYLIWTVNEHVGLGARYEWLYAGEGVGTALSPNVITPGTHFHAFTLGANVGVRGCFTFRPEIRYDWADFDGPAPGPFDNGTESSQFTYGIQTIFTW